MHNRAILFAVVGLSPQVITETLYALHQEGKRVDEIRIITTSLGRDRILSTLLLAEKGLFHQYLCNYGISKESVIFNESTIIAVSNESGQELSDIVSEEDNSLLLKVCLAEVHKFTTQENTTIYFSIAGGRKTMSACLTIAAQLYGRRQDRIYHVLVPPEFESSKYFYFPPVEPQLIELRDDNNQVFFKSSEYAKISLASLPLLPFREIIGSQVLMDSFEPSLLCQLIAPSVSEILVVNVIQRKLVYRGIECDLTPVQFALYLFFIELKNNNFKFSNIAFQDGYVSLEEIFKNLELLRTIYLDCVRKNINFNFSDTGIQSLSAENFNSYKSKMNKRIRESYGLHIGSLLEIGSKGSNPNKRHGIALDSEKINVVY